MKEGNEISILEKILEGKQNKEIAEEMNVKVKSIEAAKKRIFNRIYPLCELKIKVD
ncbi:MAG: LuxR C-terminal-related transcriptional regulator [Bacteroidetes bacterium]|nr:LuxR C-terminal-related transcriptional regulator [Bacteroidota bacterium]